MPDFDALTRDELYVLCKQLWEQVQLLEPLRARIAALEAEIERLKKDPPSGVARAVPSFVKPSRAPRPKKPKKKRPHSYVRHREEPTRIVEHRVQECPDCGRKLSGGWVHRVRQVIEVPVVPYEVIEHRFLRCRCGVCGKDHVASADLSGEVVGKHRIGVRLMSLLVYLKQRCRMPVRSIQGLLKSLWGLHLSIGEIAEALHAAARFGQGLYEALKEKVRGSPFVHGDETGWREDGKGHWLWSFSTPDARLFVTDKSRGQSVPPRVLGERYEGIVVSDFLSAYSYHLGLHQRCWVHYLRDLKALCEEHPADAGVGRWVQAVRAVYDDAKAFRSEKRQERVSARERFQERLYALALPYAKRECPQRLLAQRIIRFVQEMFTFVEHPGVPSDNNPAERAIRPAVIYRKVCGGTRSPKGSATAAALMSLVATWSLNGRDPLEACVQMLSGHPGIQSLSHQS
jgi:transposase